MKRHVVVNISTFIHLYCIGLNVEISEMAILKPRQIMAKDAFILLGENDKICIFFVISVN